MYCKKCGAALPDGAKFCGNCGNMLNAAPAPGQYAAANMPPQGYTQHQRVDQPTVSRITWPPVIGILMAVALVLYIAAQVLDIGNMRYFGVNLGGIVFQTAINVFVPLLAMILFFVPTRRVPVVTAIPRWIALLAAVLSLIMLANNGASSGIFRSQLTTFLLFTLLPTVLYTVGTAAKPRTVVIAIIFLVIALIGFFTNFFGFDWRRLSYGGMERRMGIYMIVSAVADLFAAAAYTIALFCSRRKYYPEKQ